MDTPFFKILNHFSWTIQSVMFTFLPLFSGGIESSREQPEKWIDRAGCRSGKDNGCHPVSDGSQFLDFFQA